MKAKIVSIGSGALAITSEDFLNGYQAGHLAYMADVTKVHFSDRHVTSLLMEQLEDVDHSEPYNFGYVVGWLATLANKGQEVSS